MSDPADTATRAGFITGLRELADYLAANPGVPVPPHGDCLTVSVNFTEEGGAFQVREAASPRPARVGATSGSPPPPWPQRRSRARHATGRSSPKTPDI